jgi:uncharacterized protein (DUF1919 family)
MTDEDDKQNLLNRDFTLISDDCWGGYVYNRFGLQYNTPFIWLIINPKDYLKLLKNIKYYLLDNELVFLRIEEFNFPIAVLGDILIYFKGYKTAEEADEKWRRRLQRMNWDNLFVKMTVKDEVEAAEFGKLKYKNKIAFRNNETEFDVVKWLNTG